MKTVLDVLDAINKIDPGAISAWCKNNGFSENRPQEIEYPEAVLMNGNVGQRSRLDPGWIHRIGGYQKAEGKYQVEFEPFGRSPAIRFACDDKETGQVIVQSILFAKANPRPDAKR